MEHAFTVTFDDVAAALSDSVADADLQDYSNDLIGGPTPFYRIEKPNLLSNVGT